MISRFAVFVIAALCITFSSPVTAIYQDQAGQYDWIKQQVGIVKIAKSSPGANALFLATESNIIAAVNPKDGSLLWRKVLDETETISALGAWENTAVSISDFTHLRAFQANGQVAWEEWLPGSKTGKAAVAIAGNKGSPIVIAAAAGQVQAYKLNSGVLMWSKPIAEDSYNTLSLHINEAEGDVVVTAIDTKASSYVVSRLQVQTGQPAAGSSAENNKQSVTGTASQPVALAQAGLVLASNGRLVCSASVGSSGACQKVGNLVTGSDIATALLHGDCGQYAVLQTANGGSILKYSDGKLTATAYLEGTALSGCYSTAGGVPSVVSVLTTDSQTKTAIFNAQDGKIILEHVSTTSLKKVAAVGTVLKAVFAHPVTVSADGGGSAAGLVQLEEATLALVGSPASSATSSASEDKGVHWVRNEALAFIEDTMFADLPAPTSEIEAQWMASQPDTAEKLRIQLLTLKRHFGLATPEEKAMIQRHTLLTSDRLRPTRDADGFRRQLIVTTSVGKILSLHSGDGHVIWSIDFGPQAAAQKLVTWKVPHDAQHDGEIAAVRVNGQGLEVTVLDVRTGELLQSYGRTIVGGADFVLLPTPIRDGSADQNVFAVVPKIDRLPVTVLPDSSLANAALQSQGPLTGHWRVDAATGTIKGYLLGKGDAGLVETWSVVVAPPSSGAEILSISTADPAESVYSYARSLPNGAVRLKHLTPNTIAVVTGAPNLAAAKKSAVKLTVYILDAISGRVLATEQNDQGCGPVQSIVSENWVVYHYWNIDMSKWEMSVVEMYRGQNQPMKVMDMIRGTAVNETLSAWENIPLELERQSFFIRLPARTLTATKTRQGVTAKQLLLATPSGQVLMVDKRLLDPRRPIVAPDTKPTKEQIAEGLPVYQPELPVMGPAYVTLNYHVARLKAVRCAPAVLESTTLLAVTGLDIFFSRVAPSRGFDMVPDDFPAALLVFMMVAMVVAVMVTRAVLTSKALKLKWQ